jgi:hypothetical protein
LHRLLIAIAENDDARSPKEEDVLKETFATAKLPAEEDHCGSNETLAVSVRPPASVATSRSSR